MGVEGYGERGESMMNRGELVYSAPLGERIFSCQDFEMVLGGKKLLKGGSW
jgi:hypothetical protein